MNAQTTSTTATWTRSDSIEGNGYFWTNGDETVSAFEDTSEGYSQWYAWSGSTDDHDRADHSAVFLTLDEAVNEVPA